MAEEFKKGDKVEIIKGDYTGAKGTLTSVFATYAIVQPDENADSKPFTLDEIKVIEKKPPIKVIFLDFDGVLNSAGSFLMEKRIRDKDRTKKHGPVNETLCNVCTSNFIKLLEQYPEAKIVLSTAWRTMFPMDWLKAKLTSYGIDGEKVIGKTDSSFRDHRGGEIADWLEDHPEVTEFVIIDDRTDMEPNMDHLVLTTWDVGMTLPHTFEAIQILKGKKKKKVTNGNT